MEEHTLDIVILSIIKNIYVKKIKKISGRVGQELRITDSQYLLGENY